jgi:Ca2+-binding RTX toxin-like protein
MIEALESRQLFAVALVGTTLQCTGGAGNDTFLFAPDSAGDIMVMDSTAGGLVTTWPAAAVTSVDVRTLGGNDQVDAGPYINKQFVMRGGPGDDTLRGSAAADLLIGEAGHDLLAGRAGNDTLDGQAGNDQLFGNNGDDFLIGGAGADNMFGQAGNDFLDALDGTPDGIVDGGAGVDNGIWDLFDPVVSIP